MHNHKLELIWHFSCLKMDFYIKMSQVLTPCSEPSWDWERGQRSSSSARALPASFFPHFFEAVFYTIRCFIREENTAESKLEILLFHLTESRESISDSHLCPLEALGWEASRRKAEAELPGAPQQLLQSFCKVDFARKCTLSVPVHKQVLPAQAQPSPQPPKKQKKSIIL